MHRVRFTTGKICPESYKSCKSERSGVKRHLHEYNKNCEKHS